MKARVLVFILGCIVAFGGLEVCLRAIGGIENSQRRLQVRSGASDYFTILCLGNSYTAGSGAPPGHAYCNYLQKRIDATPNLTSKNIRVINLGKGNYNSSQILEALPSDIEQYHPNLALIMAGEPNRWNRWGFDRYFERKGRDEKVPKLYDVLYASRVFRLGGIVYERVRADLIKHFAPRSLGFPHTRLSDRRALGLRWFGSLYDMRLLTVPELSEPEIDEALAALKELDASWKDEGGSRGPARTIGAVYWKLKRYDEALDWYERSLRNHPEIFNFDVYHDLNNVAWEVSGPRHDRLMRIIEVAKKAYPGDLAYKKLEQYFLGHSTGGIFWLDGAALDQEVSFVEKVRKIRPDDELLVIELYQGYTKQGRVMDAINVLVDGIHRNPFGTMDMIQPLLLTKRGHNQLANDRIDEILAKFRRDFPGEAGLTTQTTDRILENWIRSDLVKMADLLGKSGAKFIFQTYPPKHDFTTRIADQVILKLIHERGYPLSDTLEFFNASVFKKTPDRNSVYSDWLGAKDDHLNSDGNRMLADFIFESIQKYGYFPN